MQLVQPSKFFSVTIFRTRFIGARYIDMHACEPGLSCYSMLKNLLLLWELHALFSEGVYKPLVHYIANMMDIILPADYFTSHCSD